MKKLISSLISCGIIPGMIILSLTMIACTKDTEIKYYETGEKLFEVPLKNGKRDGTFIEYYRNGVVRTTIEYSNGKREGVFLAYDSSGNLFDKVHYEAGIQHGPFTIFYPKLEKVRIIGRYKNGKPDSLGFEYFPNGKVRGVYFYDAGELKYFKEYGTSGSINQSRIVPNVYFADGFLNIGLDYSYGDKNRIGVIIGSLDEQGNLKDTLEVLGTPEGTIGLRYPITNSSNQNVISGKLVEIKMPGQQIIGDTTFMYKLP